MNCNTTCPTETNTARTGRHIRPAYHIRRDEDGASLAVALPGVARDSIAVTFHQGSLLVEAKRPNPVPDGLKLVRGHCEESNYRLALRVSDRLDGEKVEASLNDGVLELRLTLREDARPRRIEVA